MLINNGDGVFRDETGSRLPQSDNLDAWIQNIVLMDIDGDGSPDIGIRTSGATCEKPFFYLNGGSGVFSRLPSDFSPDAACGFFAPLDVDADGGRDLFWVIGANGGGPEYHFIAKSVGAPIRPGRVTNLTVVRTSATARLAWSYVWGATQYEVWRTTDGDPQPVRLGTSRFTAFFDESLPNGMAAVYLVRALNSAGAVGQTSRVQVGALAHR